MNLQRPRDARTSDTRRRGSRSGVRGTGRRWGAAVALIVAAASIVACGPSVGSLGPIGVPSPRTEAPLPGETGTPVPTPATTGIPSTTTPGTTPPPVSSEPPTATPGAPGATATPAPPATARPTRPPAQPTPAPATPAPTPVVGSTDVAVYFLMDSGQGATLVPVARTLPGRPSAIATAAMNELLAGPNGDEAGASPSIVTAMPADTLLLGLSVDQDDRVATIDLTREFEGGGASSQMARLAQVVYTLTQFRTVDSVRFLLDGGPVGVPTSERGIVDGPVGRGDYVSVLPPVFVDSPAWGGRSNGLVSGSANVFEATFFVELADAEGTVLDARVVTASCGTGCWGDFEVDLSGAIDDPGRGTLTVFTRSAMDGSVQDVRRYPVRLRTDG